MEGAPEKTLDLFFPNGLKRGARCTNRGFLKWWYPTTIGFPTQNDHFGVSWRYHHLRKHTNRDSLSIVYA